MTTITLYASNTLQLRQEPRLQQIMRQDPVVVPDAVLTAAANKVKAEAKGDYYRGKFTIDGDAGEGEGEFEFDISLQLIRSPFRDEKSQTGAILGALVYYASCNTFDEDGILFQTDFDAEDLKERLKD